MNYAEQIKAWLVAKQAKVARMQEIQDTCANHDDGAGRSKTDEEQKEFDELKLELVKIEREIADLEQLQALDAQTAVPAAAAPASSMPAAQQRSRTRPVTRNADDSFEGQSFVRKVIAKSLARIDDVNAVGIAQARWGKTNPELVECIRADVAGHGSSSGEAGAELVSADNRYTGDFIEFLHAQTIYFRLPLREVPANVTIKGQDGAMTGYWVGESKGIPVTKGDFSTVSLTPLKVACIAVGSKEWLRDSNPSAERLVRDELVKAARQRIDATFLSTAAASSGVSPAGALNGVSALPSAGVDATAVRTDIRSLLTPYIQNHNGGGQWLLMNPLLAVSLALMTNSLSSAAEFPSLTMEGGSIKGLQVLTGDNLPDDWFVMVKPSDIWKIGATGIEVSMSTDASLAMSDAPSLDTDTPTEESVTSMFQTESVAFKIVQPMNFQKRRTHAAQYIADAQYGETETVTA